ncbi:uncharacterized protein LOC62_03G004399 [Vanrija pseudolonga]|uniref:Uncharacterized protein n=1 Tax=Vanrija pseudolonga TaxID=143232 RepID=A0AAF0YC50_9TREE|nr:hypothetical protein LOC62_03G004399 [Vanrija pseudolonga]
MSHPDAAEANNDHLPPNLSNLGSLFPTNAEFLPEHADALLESAIEAAPPDEPAPAPAPVIEPEIHDAVPELGVDLDPELDKDAEAEADDTPRRPRKVDPSALEVTSSALRAENERLRRIILAMEGGAVVDSLEGDLLPQHTLRELASAAVSEAELASFGFESLQQHLDQQRPEDAVAAVEAAAQQAAQNFALAPATEAAASPADFLYGLTARVAPSRTPAFPADYESDPFKVAAAALHAEIEATRAAIAEQEAQIAACKAGSAPPPADSANVPGDLARTIAAVDSDRRKTAVLRDIASRLQASRDDIQREIVDRKAELALLALDDADAEDAEDAQRGALVEVRSYVEGLIKMYKETGTLPPAPLPPLSLLVRAEALQPPPSSLPKKRGRPARATQKASVVPMALAHLVPDPEAVRDREQNTPIRRKGVKRNKVELEREKQREEEEGEMLRSLAGIGVWAREGYVNEV